MKNVQFFHDVILIELRIKIIKINKSKHLQSIS